MTQGPEAAALEDAEKKQARTSALGQYLTMGFGEAGANYLAEAGDPFEVAGNLLPLLKGAKAVKKGLTVSQRLREVGTGALGEVVSEQGSLTVDNPFASLEQRKQVAKDTLAGVLGLSGVGAAGGMIERGGQTIEGDTPGAVVGGAGPAQPAGATITPLVGIAQRAGQADLAPVPDVQSGLADLGTVEGDLLSDARFRPPAGSVQNPVGPMPLDPGRFGNVTSGLASLPEETVAGPGVVESVPQMGGEVNYEGYQGTLSRDSEGRLVVDTGDTVVEVADLRGVVNLPAQITFQAETNRNQAPLPDVQVEGVSPAPAGRGFVAVPGAQVAMVDELGKVYVPQNRRLDRTVRVAPDGAVEVLVQRVDQPGRIFRLRGAQAEQAQSALLDAVIEQESQRKGLRVPQAGAINRQGSAVPFEDVVGLAVAAIRSGVTQFSTWAAAMVRRFGEGVRSLLQRAWEAATTAANRASKAPVTFGQTPVQRRARAEQEGALLPSNALLSRGGSTVFHQAGKPFRVNSLGVRQILTGSPLPRELVPLLARTANETKALDQTSAQLARDLQVAIDNTADRLGTTREIMTERVERMMNGQAGASAVLMAIDPTLHERTRRARNFLDELSVAVSQTLPVGPLRSTLAGNLGAWMRRSYAAFDPASGWNFDSLMKAALAGRDIAGQPALKIMRDAAAFLVRQHKLPASELDARGLPKEGTMLEKEMRMLMDRGGWMSTLTGSGTAAVSQDVSSLMKRKDIPEELRRLMGEETNPVHRFLRSASFQAQFIARHHGQVAMRNAGLASGLFSSTPRGVYTVQIPAEDAPRWSGLGGMWTTPQLWEALQNAAGVTTEGTSLGGKMVEALKALGNEAKLNRVALNPDSWVVNILGNFFSLVQNGDVFSASIIRRLSKAAALVRSGQAKPGAVRSAAREAIQDANRDMLARLTAQGVLGSSITAADIEASLPRHLLQWVAEDQRVNRGLGALKGAVMGQGMGRGLGVPGRVVGGAVGSVVGGAVGAENIQKAQQKIADYVMTGPDALARTAGFLTNYETALASGMTPDAAMEWATTRTLNTFPNYAALPGVLRELSRLGLLGSFIAFQFEVYRNTVWNARHMLEEIRSGNPAMMQRGLQRLAGMGAVGALAGGGLAALLTGAGVSGEDDEERAKLFAKWFAAPWEKDAVLAFSKFDNDGVSYINTSYLLPQNTLMELVTAARNGEDPAEAASRVADRLYQQFVGSSVHLGPLLGAVMNQNQAGTPLTYRKGLMGALERADEPLQTILEPGFSKKLESLVYALRDAEKKGRKYTVEEEAKRLLGVRQVTRKWDELATNAYRKLSADYSDVRSQANRELGLNRPGAKVWAINAANEQIAKLRSDLESYEREATKLGVPVPTLIRAKKEAGVNLFRDVGLGNDGRVVSLGTRGR
jgi:hypothetical protein